MLMTSEGAGPMGIKARANLGVLYIPGLAAYHVLIGSTQVFDGFQIPP